MKIKLTNHQKTRCGAIGVFSILSVLFGTAMGIPIKGEGQPDSPPQQKPKKVILRSASSNKPSGYEQVGSTMLYSNLFENIDIYGAFNGIYYGSTFSDGGYRVALQVNGGDCYNLSCISGNRVENVDFSSKVDQQGDFARISYILTNNNEEDAVISMGTHADVMIGNNDSAPITRRIDTLGQTYGLTMSDGNGAQLCVLFGSGLAGVSAVDDFWFGVYHLNSDGYSMVGNYNSGGNYMVENGSYDSGMGWCWKNRVIPAGATVTFSYLIGVGDVNLEPNSTFGVTPDNPDLWNDLSLPHTLTIEGEYESPAGVDGRVEYAVEDSEEWTALTDMLPSGSAFENSITVNFDPEMPVHIIRFRTIDNVGNTTQLHPIEYNDVAYLDFKGIQDVTFTGDSIYQTVECDVLQSDHYTTGSYSDNRNAGTATFNIEGVFPYTIGKKSCKFIINPAPLDGEMTTFELPFFTFSNEELRPQLYFSDPMFETMLEGKDYTITYHDNKYPGTAYAEAVGIGNYTGTLRAEFFIDKGELTENLYTVTLPGAEVVYDGEVHPASFKAMEGVGEVQFRYILKDTGEEVENPVDEGEYIVMMSISEGDYYHGISECQVGTFKIFNFSEEDWVSLQMLFPQLMAAGASPTWNMEGGKAAVGTFDGLEISNGHVGGVDFSGWDLSGAFPTALLTFPALHSINLSCNNLSGDLPMTLMAVATQSPLSVSAIDTLNISSNKFNGNIGILAQCLPSLVALDASHNCFEDVYPALPERINDAKINGQKIDRNISLSLSDISIDDLVPQLPTILLYDTDGHSYSTDLRILLTTADPDNFNMLTNREWGIGLHISAEEQNVIYVSPENAFRGENGGKVYACTLKADNSIDHSFGVNLSFEMGDANFFNGVDVTDLQATVLYAFDMYGILPFNFTAADTYSDNTINVQDVTKTVNILLAKLMEDVTPFGSPAKVAGIDDAASDAKIVVREGKIFVSSNTPVAALMLKAKGNVTWQLDKYGFSHSVNDHGIVAYSLNGAELPVGETVIGECQGEVDVAYVSLSDKEARTIETTISHDNTSSVNDIDFEIDENCEIYTPDGKRIDKLVKGVNIVIRNGQTFKIYNNK